jgi:transglutaminase-like putative cysteine protease
VYFTLIHPVRTLPTTSVAAGRRPRRWLAGSLLWAVIACGVAAVQAAPVPPSVGQVSALVDTGDFKAAEAGIAEALGQPGLPSDEQRAYAFQRERMRRILLDFKLDVDDVEARVRMQIPDLTDAEFAKWNAAGLFEHQVIDGRTLYFNRSPSNLFRLSKEALSRRDPKLSPISDGPMESLNAQQRAIRDAALAGHNSSVLPLRLRMTQKLTVDADAVPAGETVRAWIPYPQSLPGHQEDIRFVSSLPAAHEIAPETAPQRTVYLEKPVRAGAPTEFAVTYELTIFGQYHAIDPDKVVAAEITPELAPYIAERAPHVVFTDAMRAFSRKVVGDETNPYRIVQKLFAAVDEIPWAGAREYSTIANISDYALHAGHADCGQQTLLLITLLRMNGIPARWQSGMVFSDGDYSNIHDWGQVYLAPYGWVPMDVTLGRLKSGDPRIDGFYLGGLDAYRLVFNDDFSQPFVPAKQHVRSETVDSQRGEVEWRGGNLYFDQWDYRFEAHVLTPARQ